MGPSVNKVSISSVCLTFRSRTSMRQNRVVPVSMKLSSFAPQSLHLGIADFDPGGVRPRIEGRLNMQSLCRRGGANQADDNPPTHQRLATPIGGGVAEQPGLDLFPPP